MNRYAPGDDEKIYVFSSPRLKREQKCDSIFDNVPIVNWSKSDFDKNGETDLYVCFTTWKRFPDFNPQVVMSFKGDSFRVYRIGDQERCDLAVPVIVDDTPALIRYKLHYGGFGKVPRKVSMTQDTLIYRNTYFVEWNRKQTHYSIEKIEFSTTHCYGTCPAFNLTILPNGNASFDGELSLDNNGKYNTVVDSGILSELFELVNYIDFPLLNDAYACDVSDQQLVTLVITYDGGKLKSVTDYGLIGTFGLSLVYKSLYQIRSQIRREYWQMKN